MGVDLRERAEHDAVGNRSLLLRDPDGNLVNLFTPATDAAREKFSNYER